MKTTPKKLTKKAPFVVGRHLPEKLPKKAIEFLSNAETPKRALDIAAKVSRIAAKNKSTTEAKRAC